MNGNKKLLIGLAAASASVAVSVFKVPLPTILLVAVVLACPFLMAGMHGGHGRDRDEERNPHHHDQTIR